MRRKALVGIILLCLAVGIFSAVPNVNADEEEFVAMVVDVDGVETTNIHDLYLYYYSEWGGPYMKYYKEDSAKSMLVRRGESDLTIPFTNIREMEFEWAETEEEKSTIMITALSGEKIKGEPLRVSHWSFKGKTDFGDFSLSVKKTKKVMLSHGITPASPSPTPVTATPTPIPSPTPTSSSSPVPTQTPTSSPGQVSTPIPKTAGFEAVFAIAGLMAVAYILRRNRK